MQYFIYLSETNKCFAVDSCKSRQWIHSPSGYFITCFALVMPKTFSSLVQVRLVNVFALTTDSLHRGDGEIRTLDPLLARQVLSQLSYAPGHFFLFSFLLGLSGLEPPTSRLSGVRSNRLSYKPVSYKSGSHLLSHVVSNIVPSAA